MSLTGVLVAGALRPSASLAFSSALTTVWAGVNVAVEPSGNVTVAVPSLATSTSSSVGLAFTISSATCVFSSSVKALVSFTGVLAAGS